jgi:hypothetical protein
MSTKKLTVSETKKIQETIRFLKIKSWDSSKSEIEKTRKEIHSLQDKLDQNKSKSKINKSIMATKKPTVRGLKKVCSHVVKATGLKVDGTLKKGYKYATGGKIVKVAPAKKPVAKKKVVKKSVAKKKPAVKKKAAKK